VKLDADRATLVVIDVQEAFRKALPSFGDVAAASATHPKGLGATVDEVASHLPEGSERVEKVRFSAAEVEGFDLGERDQALVCGIEAHVCVNQTVLDLIDEDVEVHVAADAVGSRTEDNRELGLAKMERAGAIVSSVEMALFELLGGSDAEAFKQVQGLVK
jgi:isochorismate hydrolase